MTRPILLGIVTNSTSLGFFRVAQAPMNGFAALGICQLAHS